MTRFHSLVLLGMCLVPIVAAGQTPAEWQDVVRNLRNPDVKARMADIGLTPASSTPEAFDAFIRTEIDKWAKVVKASGATAD